MTQREHAQATTLDQALRAVSPGVGRVLDNALAGQPVPAEDGVLLLESTGLDTLAVMLTADTLRRRAVGDVATYVVNRNINFTNVCIKGCGFCAFSRDFRAEQGYYLPTTEIVRRAQEAWDLGATEVCVQAGLPPKMEGDLYITLTKALKAALPDLHIHGFSPEEVLYGSVRSGWSIKDYLTELKAAGVGSLPGTSAEILDQEVRDRIAPGRIRVSQWTEVITTAHALGIPTTSTIMYGHLETSRHVANHLALIRAIQADTGGFTEFVPLSFIHSEAPMWHQQSVPGLRAGPTGMEVLKVHAVSRIMLDNIPHLQASWVKEGQRFAQLLLAAGVDDLGGTLINESISTSAGAGFGQLVKPKEFRKLIRDAGRIPAERRTSYQLKHVFEQPEDDPTEPLDMVGDKPEERFGSYKQLAASSAFRFAHPNQQAAGAPKPPTIQAQRPA